MTTVLSGREASIFTCFADVVVSPAGDLPAVRETDALQALEEHLRAAPPVNRAGIRGMLLAIEVAPRLTGHGARLRRLAPAARADAVTALARHPAFGPVVKALQGVAHMTYYGDDRVMRGLGYDADAIIGRAALLRAREGRW